MKYKALQATEEVSKTTNKTPNNDSDADGQTCLLKKEDPEQVAITVVSSIKSADDAQNEIVSPLPLGSPLYICVSCDMTYEISFNTNPPKSWVGLLHSP